MSLYAGYRTTRFRFDRHRQGVWRAIAEYLQRYIPPEGAVLDLGSGYCDFINAVRARRKWAVDLYLDPAEFAAEGVTPVRSDVTDLAAVPDGELDAVFCSNLLEHLSDDKLALTIAGVKSKLRPGGRLLAVQPNFRYCFREYFDDYTHVRVFTHVSLADFLEAHGLVVERVVPRFLPFSMKSRLPKSELLVRAYLRLPYRPWAKQMLVIAKKP
ncbi:MAG TPA: class I SAM-dependent methyltransferase [Planctomycetota bacterium]|jgi:SAM-dependent methyltransferase|nr:class I SAM-dependent methyltransferase [Planctomycetota bacterium]